MAWTDIEDADVAVGAPVSSALLTALRDNDEALSSRISGAPEFIAQATASGDSVIDFTDMDNTIYDSYDIHLANVIPATDGTLSPAIRVSTNGGASFVSATAYDYTVSAQTGSGIATIAANNQPEVRLVQASQVGGASGEHGVTGVINVSRAGASLNTQFTWRIYYDSVADAPGVAWGGGRYDWTSPVDALRFFFTTGNVEQGTITLMGRRLVT